MHLQQYYKVNSCSGAILRITTKSKPPLNQGRFICLNKTASSTAVINIKNEITLELIQLYADVAQIVASTRATKS